MKRTGFPLLPVALFALAAAAALAQSSTPSVVRLQGYLSDMSGGPKVPGNGLFTMTFELFDDPLAGMLIATAGPIAVSVADGLYEVELPFAASEFQSTERWIQITVEGEVLAPRVRIGSMPFAYVAENVDGHEGDDLEESDEILLVQTDLQSQVDDLQTQVTELPGNIVPGDSTNVLFRNAATGLLEASPELTYTPRAFLGPFINFDVGQTQPHDQYQTLLRWFPPADVDASGAALDPDYKFGAYCGDGNRGHCAANSGIPCYESAECPEGDSCAGADPQGACNWISSWCFNCGDSAGQGRRSTTRHQFSINMASHFWEVGSCSPAGDSCEHQAVSWDYRGTDGRFHKPFLAELRITGICQGGGRDGEICFPDGQLGGCPGGTCSKVYDTNRFAWYANGRWGSCVDDPDLRCDDSSQCGSGGCTTGPTSFGLATFQVSAQVNLITAAYPIDLRPYEYFAAGDVDANGEAALRVAYDSAPAGDTDGVISGGYFLTRLTAKTDPGGQLAALRGVEIINQINADDNDSDVASLVGISVFNDVNYSGAVGGVSGDDVSDNDIQNAVGVFYASDFSTAVDTRVAQASGLWLERPGPLTDATTVREAYGIRIEDQVPSSVGSGSWGNAGLAVIDIRPQDSSGLYHDANRGNLRFWSQDHDGGHIQFGVSGAQHLWSDGTSLRVKDGTPVTATDGGRVFHGECGDVSVNPGSVQAESHGLATVAIPNVSADGPCSCALSSDFGAGVIYQYCRASAGTLQLSLYNVTTSLINPPSRTVSYCCFED